MDHDLAADVKQAEALLLESAIALYRQRGHSVADAQKLAEALVNAPAKHQLPEFDDLRKAITVARWIQRLTNDQVANDQRAAMAHAMARVIQQIRLLVHQQGKSPPDPPDRHPPSA